MTDNQLVSIIIPVYNAGAHLKQAIDCAVNQTWKNKEIIIINDGSTDHSLRIAGSFTEDQVRVISRANKGAGAARNLGLREARGAYIQFLDADDLLSVDKIETQMSVLENQPGKLAVCSTVHFPEGADPASIEPSAYEDSFLAGIADPVEFLVKLWGGYDNAGSMIQPNAWLVPMELIKKAGPWNEQLTLDDDGEFFCRVILNSAGIIKTNGFNYYRKHPENTSLSGKKTNDDLGSLLRSALSKKKELLSRIGTKAAQHAVYRQLYDVFLYSYPSYPAIYQAARRELPKNTGTYKPVLGGKAINLFADLFGVRAALYIRHILNKHNA
jgi:glycosyltransferase involved in cell wall biosynthesis